MTHSHPKPPHQPRPPELPEPLVALTRACSLLGRRGIGLIITALARGPADVAKVSERLPGLGEGLLTRSLRELTTLGLVTRTAAPDTPSRSRYALSARGKALLIPLAALTVWAEDHLSTNAPEARAVRGRQLGRPAQVPGLNRHTHAADRGHVRDGREGEQTAQPAPRGPRDSRRARASLRASRLRNRPRTSKNSPNYTRSCLV
ncbi:winged helix-turn-helix transcriptional regulator [Streptomyces sp. WI04-05B]|uniref:winged helix-turn-helix transcriptional regulator n=1 Tax=Streptomyces TaxID=1883 RepID=UPI0029AB490F|nr:MULTISPECIES: helix-turn-helix domain-containing protein [unclassified Streptomyces]MDX2546306.1 helix-turn-helix domain-containing protein [Streptomyces sp. WI04-05B]MDX2589241.1 helix-turn-helix domain-containing protein [Streptomyces sp. WI04-05A]